MTGKKTDKTRVIVSPRLLVPAPICRDLNQKALDFRNAIYASVVEPRLNPDIAAKAANINAKPTYEDTDNKKRDFTGGNVPGMEQQNGYRWIKGKKFEPGDELHLFPDPISRFGSSNKPNFGWIKPSVDQEKPKPRIRITKYKRNPRTGEIIPGTGVELDPLAAWTGRSFEENQEISQRINDAKKFGNQNEKMLPGRPLKSRVPGGNLITRVASKFGIWLDANNKFRCPPGTPAANQFTDAYGTNCFGVSAERAAKLVADKIGDALRVMNTESYDLTPESLSSGAVADLPDMPDVPGAVGELVTENLSRSAVRDMRRAQKRKERGPQKHTIFELFDSATNFLLNGDFSPTYVYDEQELIELADPHGGIPDPIPGGRGDWTSAKVPPGARKFKNAMARAERSYRVRDSRFAAARDAMGIDSSEERIRHNHDVYDMLDGLREKGGWDLEISYGPFGKSRPSESQIKSRARKHLRERIGAKQWNALDKATQERYIEAKYKEYRAAERGFLGSIIDEYMQNPEVVGRAVRRLEFRDGQQDEAGFTYTSSSATVGPDGKIKQVDAVGTLYFRPEKIFETIAEANGLPRIDADEALVIEAVGDGISDAEAKSAVVDHLTGLNMAGRFVAHSVRGPESLGAHIGYHELSHALVGDMTMQAVDAEFKAKGYVEVVINGERRRISGSSAKDLTSDEMMAVMVNVFDQTVVDLSDAKRDLPGLVDVAGEYAQSSYDRGGNNIGLHETVAELWALRRQGIIFGDDIDKALSLLDETIDGRHIDERTDIEATRFTDPRTYRPTTSSIDLTDDELKEKLEEADMRSAEDRRNVLAILKERYKQMDENQLVEAAGAAQLEIDRIAESPDAETEIARQVMEFHEKALSNIRNEWSKRFGVGSRGERNRFNEMVEQKRDELDLLTPEQLMMRSERKRKEDFAEVVSTMTEDEIVDRLADIDARKESTARTSEELSPDVVEQEIRNIAMEEEVLKSEVVDRARKKGDKRSYAKIVDEMREKVEVKNTPKPQKTKKFSSRAQTRKTGKVERARLRRQITKEQADALKQLGDMSQPGVAQMFDVNRQVAVGQSINKKHNRLKKLGLETDAKSTESGSLTDQIENVLIPAMEAIDKSSAGFPMEVEAIIDVESGQLTGRSVGKSIDMNGFTGGKIINKTDTPTAVPRGRDAKTGKLKRRVVIEVQPGDKGIFPAGAKDETQKFVMPPGTFRVVGRDADGTIRVRVERQKDTTEVIDDLASSIDGGTDNRLWRESTAKKVKAISAKRFVAIEKSESTESLSSGRSANFGKSRETVRIESDELRELISRIKDPNTYVPLGRDSFGRNDKRQIELRKLVENALPGLNRDGLDPEVVKILDTMSPEEIDFRLRRTALSMHRGFDKRVRVRMRESELDDFAKAGSVRYSTRSLSSGAPVTGLNRARSRGVATESGRNQSELEADTAKATAAKVKAITDELNGRKLEELDEATLNALGISKVNDANGNQARSKVTKQKIYRAKDSSTALAMLALGHTVSMEDEGEAKMVQDASKEAAKAIAQFRETANDTVKKSLQTINLCRFYLTSGGVSRNIFCPKSIGVEREQMPQVSGRVVDENSLALRAYVGGLIPGETLGAHISTSVVEAIDKTKIGNDKPILGRDGKVLTYVDKNGKLVEVIGNNKLAKYVETVLAKDKWDDLTEDEKWVVQNLGSLIVERESMEKAMDPSAVDNLRFAIEKLKTTNATVKEFRALGERHSYEFDGMSESEKTLLYDNMDWRLLEPDTLDHFISYLEQTGTSVSEERDRSPDTLYASQSELDAEKVDGLSAIMHSELKKLAQIQDPGERKAAIERLKQRHGLFKKIIISKDGYIVDGHHRVIGRLVANGLSKDDLETLDMTVRVVDMPIIDLLTISRAYQDKMGFKSASLSKGAPETYQNVGRDNIVPLTRSEWDAVNVDFASEADERISKIYADGHFVKIDSVGIQSMPQEEADEVLSKFLNAKDAAGKISSMSGDERQAVIKALSRKAADLTRRLDSGQIDISTMSDEQLEKEFGGLVSRSTSVLSVDGEAVYDVSNAAHAKALLAHGYRVNMTDNETALLTEQGITSFNDELKTIAGKEIADNNAEWLKFRDSAVSEYKASNGGREPTRKAMKAIEKRYKEQFTIDMCKYYIEGQNLFCGDNVDVERESMPQLSGRATGFDSPAIQMLVAGTAGGSWEFDVDKIDDSTPDGKRAAERYKSIAKKYKDFKTGAVTKDGKKVTLTDEEVKFLMDHTDWALTEVDIIPQLRELVKAKLGKGTERKFINPSEMTAAQNQLVGDKVAGMADTVKKAVAEITEDLVADGFERGTAEFTNELRERLKKHKEFKNGKRGASGLFEATLAAKGGYMLDGHHRWAGLMMANRSLDADQQVELQIEIVDTDILSGLELGRIVQDHFGIKPAKLTGEIPYKEGEIKPMGADDAKKHLTSLISSADEKIKELETKKIFRRKAPRQQAANESQSLSSGAFGASAVINASAGRSKMTPTEQMVIADRQIRAQTNKKYVARELRDAKQRLEKSRDPLWNKPDASIEAEIGHLENLMEAHEADSMLGRMRGILVDKKNRKSFEKIAKTIKKSKLDSDTSRAIADAIKSIIEAEEFGELDYNGISESLQQLSKLGGLSASTRIIDELDERNMLTDKQIEGLRYVAKKYSPDVSRELSKMRMMARDRTSRGKTVDPLDPIRDIGLPSSAIANLIAPKPKDFRASAEIGDQLEINARVYGVVSEAIAILDERVKPTDSVGRTRGQNSLSSGAEIPRFDGKTKNRALNELSKEFYKGMGLDEFVAESNFPVSGYLVHESHINHKKNMAKKLGKGNIDNDAVFELQDKDIIGDGLTALGEIEVVLKPGVSERTAYGRGNGLSTGHRPVLMNSIKEEDILAAHIGGNGKKANNSDAMANLLTSSIDKNFSNAGARRDQDGKLPASRTLDTASRKHDNFEAHILGGFDKDEVEAIHYPFSKIQKNSQNEDISDAINANSIADKLRKAGFSDSEIQYFYSISDGKPFNTASMQALRNYRYSQKVKNKYKELGFDNVRIAHPDGINIDDPRSYVSGSKRTDNAEKAIINRIMSEIEEAAKKMKKDRDKREAPVLVSSRGS